MSPANENPGPRGKRGAGADSKDPEDRKHNAPYSGNKSGATDKLSALRETWRHALMMSGLAAGAKLTALAMLEDTNRKIFDRSGDLQAWPTLATLARHVDLSQAQVKRHRAQLCQRGVIVVVRAGGRGRATLFRFDARWLAQADKTWKADTSTPDIGAPMRRHAPAADVGASMHGYRRTNAPIIGACMRPHPSEYPTENPTERVRPRVRADSTDLEGKVVPLRPPAGRPPITTYVPPPAVIAWAAEHAAGIDALADDVLGKFRDWHRAKGRHPRDLDGAFRNWLRQEVTFRERGRQQQNGGRSTLSEKAINLAKEKSDVQRSRE
jgi:hypothetical protein